MSQSSAARSLVRPAARPAARPKPQPPRLRLVVPARRPSAAGLALLCVSLLGGGLLALLLLNIAIGKGAYRLSELQSRQRLLAVQQQTLAERVDALGAPQALAASARRLGMVPDPNAAFLRLPDGAIEGDATPAKAPAKPVTATATVTKPATTKPATTKGTTNKGTTTKPATNKGTTAANRPVKQPTPGPSR